MLRLTSAAVALAVGIAASGVAGGQERADCGSLANAYGPFDYRNAQYRAEKIPVVEQHHFNADVESLRRGQTGTIMGDLDYTLRAVPNHHRALTAVARYAIAGGKPEKYYTAECYFDRAVRFAPDDGLVRLLHATFLHRKKNLEAAKSEYLTAISLLPESSEAHYNLALLWLDLGDVAKAKQEAIVAYRLGHPMPGLKNKLRQRAAWTDEDEQATRAGSDLDQVEP